MKSLKTKILFYFIIFIILPLSISVIYIFMNMHSSFKELTYNKHMQILKIVENRADKIVTDIEYLATYIKEIKNENERTKSIQNIVNTSSIISSVVILNKNGFEKLEVSKNKYSNTNRKDYSNKKFFKDIKNGKEFCWSGVYLSKINNLPAISYTLKIDDDNILVMIVNISLLDNLANEFKTPSNESLVRIIDNSGLFLVNTGHPEFVMQRKSIYKSNLYQKYISQDFQYKQIQFLDLEKKNSIAVYGETKKLHWYILIKETYDNIFYVFEHTLLITLVFLIILLFITIYFALRLSKSIIKPIDNISKNMYNISHNKNQDTIKKTKYFELNSMIDSFNFMYKKIKNRENTILDEVEKNKQKDKKLVEQSKMASMGEMIENIAHQWRQPLSVISTIASGMKLEKDFGKLNDEKIEKYCSSINAQTQYLSQTIDDFKNFIKNEKELKSFNISKCITRFEKLIQTSSTNNKIRIIKNIDDTINIKNYENELVQCLMNVFHNAKDAFSEEIKNRLFIIEIFSNNNDVYIILKDNANGIPSNIINKIFEPYFTTKHKSKGTGLGLHMTYNLIKEGMKGEITVCNEEYTFENNLYNGASFKIKLPLSL